MRTHNKPDFAARLFKVLRRTSKAKKLELDFAAGCDGAIREIIDFETLENFEVTADRYDEVVVHLETLSEFVTGGYQEGYMHVADLVRRYASALRNKVSY